MFNVVSLIGGLEHFYSSKYWESSSIYWVQISNQFWIMVETPGHLLGKHPPMTTPSGDQHEWTLWQAVGWAWPWAMGVDHSDWNLDFV